MLELGKTTINQRGKTNNQPTTSPEHFSGAKALRMPMGQNLRRQGSGFTPVNLDGALKTGDVISKH
eukprot:12901944-Ditylum_brightwellii.AAC.1